MQTLAQLRVIRAALYAILVTLLLILGGVLYTTLHPSALSEAKDVVPFCGTESPTTPAVQRGKELFIANCAPCHHKNMRDKLTGPPLGPALAAWEQYPKADLYAFIRHSQRSIKEGHPRARQIWQEYKPTLMNDFSNLTDAQLEDLVGYVRNSR